MYNSSTKQKEKRTEQWIFIFLSYVSDVGIVVSVEILLLVSSAPTNDC